MLEKDWEHMFSEILRVFYENGLSIRSPFDIILKGGILPKVNLLLVLEINFTWTISCSFLRNFGTRSFCSSEVLATV